MNNFTFLILSICLPLNSFGQTTKQTVQVLKTKNSYEIRVDKNLNKNQLTLINFGFSTASKLLILPLEGNSQTPLYQNSCVVKFDTWEEEYEYTSFSQTPVPRTSKNIADYFTKCFGAKLDPTKMSSTSGKLLVILTIKQISESQSQQIKQWLIRQQSGVIQGLFSHMLGELKMEESVSFEVALPGESSLFRDGNTYQISVKPKARPRSL